MVLLPFEPLELEPESGVWQRGRTYDGQSQRRDAADVAGAEHELAITHAEGESPDVLTCHHQNHVDQTGGGYREARPDTQVGGRRGGGRGEEAGFQSDHQSHADNQ